TFTSSDVALEYRDTVTPPSSPANFMISGAATPGAFTITAEDLGGDLVSGWGPEMPFGGTAAPARDPGALLARTFLITLTTPLSGVGTYSYAIGNVGNPIGNAANATGPAITDFIKTWSRTTTGNPVDQNQNAVLSNPPGIPALPVPEAPDQIATGASVVNGGAGY